MFMIMIMITEVTFKGHSKSSQMSPFDRAHNFDFCIIVP